MRISMSLSSLVYASSLLNVATSLPSLAPTRSSDPLPLVIWHGLGDKYDNEGLQSVADLAETVHSGTYVYIVRLGDDPSSDRTATFFGNLTNQVQDVCDQILQDPILSSAPAINALGFSQGGQFLRAYVQRCNNPPVRNLVTFGSQHNGIAEFQKCGVSDWLCLGAMALLRSSTWSGFVQNRLVPAQYYRSVNETTGEPTEEYLENSNFLADINNERNQKNELYKANMELLENFAMYVFENDTVVIPKETGWFAQVTNLTSGVVTPLKDRPIYKEDWIGLKSLDIKGALKFRTFPGAEHMHFSDKELTKVFKEFFAPPKTAWQKFMTVQRWSGWGELR